MVVELHLLIRERDGRRHAPVAIYRQSETDIEHLITEKKFV